MATNATRTQTSANTVPAAAGRETGAHRDLSSGVTEPRKATGYGLPCLKCHLYYPADLDVCPTCKSNQRTPAAVPRIAPKAAPAAEPTPDTTVVEQEREQFLRQFKSQLLQVHAEVAQAEVASAAGLNAAESACRLEAHHSGDPAGSEICQACYERLQERLETVESALQIELKEAAQIIYDAVWADPSDPNKTYQNAASALLIELRKRAGVTAVSPFQPLQD
jgi:hypothetical protein